MQEIEGQGTEGREGQRGGGSKQVEQFIFPQRQRQ